MAHEGKRRGGNAKAAPVVVSETDTLLDEYKLQCKTKEKRKQLEMAKMRIQDGRGEHIIKDIFPKKVLELNSLLQSDLFSLSRLTEMADSKLNIPVPDPKLYNHEPPSKKRKSENAADETNNIDGSHVILLPNGSVPINAKIVEIIDLIKPQAIELIEHANHIKMWITYTIPKIEDGNNFGVSVQEDTMAEARQVESEAATYLDQISRYYLTRGKIVSKVAKYPHVDDYRRTIQELDEKEFISLRLVTTEMRNHYASLHDLIVKNLDKIKKPRSTNTDNMY